MGSFLKIIQSFAKAAEELVRGNDRKRSPWSNFQVWYSTYGSSLCSPLLGGGLSHTVNLVYSYSSMFKPKWFQAHLHPSLILKMLFIPKSYRNLVNYIQLKMLLKKLMEEEEWIPFLNKVFMLQPPSYIPISISFANLTLQGLQVTIWFLIQLSTFLHAGGWRSDCNDKTNIPTTLTPQHWHLFFIKLWRLILSTFPTLNDSTTSTSLV